MAQHEHKMFTTPVSVNDGFKRSDSKTWSVLGILLIAAIVIVALIELLVPKPKIRWPTQQAPQTQPAPATQAEPDEPRTYGVAPRGTAPPQPPHR